jgi:hypothetical protein
MTFKISEVPHLGTVDIDVQPDGPFWYADGVNVDYGAQGDTIEEAVHNFQEGLEATIKLQLKHLKNPLGLLKKSTAVRDSFIFAGIQFLSFAICTMSWRAVAQANIFAAVITDAILSTLSFFLFRKIVDSAKSDALIPWLGYTIGGVLGTVFGIYFSLWVLGK